MRIFARAQIDDRPVNARLVIATVLVAGLVGASAAVADAPSVAAASDVSGPVSSAWGVGSKTTFSYADGPATFTAQVRLVDPSGVETPTVLAGHEGSGQSHGFGSMTLVSGDSRDGVWERVITIPTTAATGQWDVKLYPTRDRLGNSGDFFRTIGTITTVGAAASDVSGPVSSAWGVGSKTTFSYADGPATFTAQVRLVDPSGVETPTVLAGHEGSGQSHGFGSMTLVSGDSRDGVWERVITIPTTAATGQWDVKLYPTRDRLGNSGDFFRTIGTITTTTLQLMDRVGTPTVTQAARVGQTLTVDPGEWSPHPHFTYSWMADGIAIPGATQASLFVEPSMLGQRITVRITGSLTGYETVTRTSNASAAVTAGSLVAGSPTLSGALAVGSTVSVEPGTWAVGVVLRYQWLREGNAIPDATGRSYVPVAADLDRSISVRVTGSTPGYSVASATSPGGVVAAGDLVSGQPHISGQWTVGSRLSVQPGYWTEGATLRYEWVRDEHVIVGATSPTYDVLASDVGRRIAVRVTGTMVGYNDASRESDSGVVATGTLASSQPTVTGAVRTGSRVSVEPGPWTSGTAFGYQWLRGSKVIAGATAPSYTLTGDDFGQRISVRVIGSNDGYASATRTSAPSDPVAAGSLKVGGPSIAGAFKVGSKVAVKAGVWTAGTSFTYQWLRNGRAIKGATKSTYVLVATDRGRRLSVKVTGSLRGYSDASRASSATVVKLGTLKTASPAVAGAAKVGSRLMVRIGAWTSGATFRHQWLRNGKAIKGATKASYTLTAADRGRRISVKVTGSKPGYSTVAKTSPSKLVRVG